MTRLRTRRTGLEGLHEVPTTRKLIEVSLPLEDINRESARDKSIRHGHPATLHLWWARRPLAAARAVLFAQLVDDPSSHPDRFPTEELQKAERERLHHIIRRLVVWENVTDERLLREAHQEILRSTDGNPPAILDPFAGGGTIPLEAQRLGLEAHASDLNPVAVLINKALLEIPALFAGRPPVFPGAAESRLGPWLGATGLAEDVRRYGTWTRERAEERIGHLYPRAKLPDGSEATVLAWIWARTVTCPNPACGVETPLVRSWWLGKKKGKEAYVIPVVIQDDVAPSGMRVSYTIGRQLMGEPTPKNDGTVGRTGATCVACAATIELKYIRSEGRARRIGAELMAIVAEGKRQRIYLDPSREHIEAADVPLPNNVPEGRLAYMPRDIKAATYGMTTFADLFTNRQLATLLTFSDIVADAREIVLLDAIASGMDRGARLAEGGSGAEAYADAVATYLAICVDRITDRHSRITTWDASPSKEQVRGVFARQAIPMAWDFAEGNPFASTSGGIEDSHAIVGRALDLMPARGRAKVLQANAASAAHQSAVIATDPPYYGNIIYSDLSDFFYVWLRRSLKDVYPLLFSTLLVPRAEELVANPYRHQTEDEASRHFEDGFEQVFRQARAMASESFPVTVYYAFKQAELESEGVLSTGWATLLEGMIRAGWTITATWPIRSELSNRMLASGKNALASSIVLALRPRHETAAATNRRGFLASLKAELPRALADMQQGAIAPVDLAQATIGPGMAVFTRYARVVESDGSPMSVRTALALINQALDEVLAEQDGDLDADSRFCLKWYTQYGWSRQPFGEADVLARAVNTAVDGLARAGVLTSREGKVALTRPAALPSKWNPATDDRISIWEVTCHLARSLANVGIDDAARLMAAASARIDLDAVQLLAYRLYELAQNKDPDDALLFNALGTSWADLSAASRTKPATVGQIALDLDIAG
jgi:putative DNA methylase